MAILRRGVETVRPMEPPDWLGERPVTLPELVFMEAGRGRRGEERIGFPDSWLVRPEVYGARTPTGEAAGRFEQIKGDRFQIPAAALEFVSSGDYRAVNIPWYIKRGGFATLVRGWDAKLQKVVACKVINPRFYEGPFSQVVLRYFYHELAILGNLHHPNLIRVYGASVVNFRGNDFPVYAMELCRGQFPRPRGSNDLVGLQAFGRGVWQVADALDYMHVMGIVHKDVKPENILTQVNEVGKAKAVLCDPGIAIGDYRSRSEWQLGHADHMLGTPLFAAPEQLRHGPITGATDQHQLALTVYEMLAYPHLPDWSQRGFFWPPDGSFGHDHVRPDQHLAEHPNLPRDVYRCLSRASAFNPGDRYRTCSEFAANLNVALRSVVKRRLLSNRGSW